MSDYCMQAKEQLNSFLDKELAEPDADVVRQHLQACEPCMDDFEVQLAIRDLLRRCCCSQRAPETLRMRVVTQITYSRSWYWEI